MDAIDYIKYVQDFSKQVSDFIEIYNKYLDEPSNNKPILNKEINDIFEKLEKLIAK